MTRLQYSRSTVIIDKWISITIQDQFSKGNVIPVLNAAFEIQ
jgi:hypothetical protein